MTITVTDLLVRVRSDTTAAMAGLGGLSAGLIGLGGIAAGVAAASFVKMGIDAQTQLSIVQEFAGATSVQMQGYTSSLEQMSMQLGSTLADSAQGLYYVVSAQFKGADATNVLRYAMMAAKASGADLADVTHGLAGALNAYGAPASQAAQYTDIMSAAVADGMQTFQEFASEMGTATAVAAAHNVTLLQLAAAESTVTDKGLPAAAAFQGLAFAIAKVMVPADAMQKSVLAAGGTFDATAYSAMSFVDRLNYLAHGADLTQTEFVKLIGGTRSSKAALDLTNDSGAAYAATLAHMATQSGITAANFAIHDKTMQAGFEDVGAAISVASYNLVNWITPTVLPLIQKVAGGVQFLGQVFSALNPQVAATATPVSDVATHLITMNTEMGRSTIAAQKLTVVQQVAAWLQDMGDKVAYVQSHWQQFEPWVIAGAAIIGGILVIAFTLWTASAIAAAIATVAATWPIIAIGAAIGLLVAALIWAYNNWGWFRTAVQGAAKDMAELGPVIDWIWGKLGGMAGVVGSLVGRNFQVLGQIIQAVGNYLGLLGNIIGGILGKLGALANAIANIHMPNLGGIHIPGFAEGGIMPGGAAIVGESGPELAIFPAGTRMIPAAQTAALMSTGSGSSVTSTAAGGYRTAVIQIMLDSRVLATSLPQPLVDRIRVATGLRV